LYVYLELCPSNKEKGNPVSVFTTFCPMFTMKLELQILPVSCRIQTTSMSVQSPQCI
jgi:hypothetical protein